MFRFALLASLLYGAVNAQKPGTLKTERHPTLQFSQCTKSGGCTGSQREVVIDSNWRWTHESGGTKNCYTGNQWDPSICPDEATCSNNCVLEGADEEYSDTYGVKSSGDTLQLDFVTQGSYSKNVGSRTYLMEDSDTYQMFKLKNREFSFDADVSNLACGLNGALYFVQMDSDGGVSKYPTNHAGAKYGTGYCDAQCPHDLKFINGEPNMLDWVPSPTDPNAGTGKYGSCCVEMDIWEANMMSTAYTAHPCDVTSQYRCEGVECGDNGPDRFKGKCDKNGCDIQPYRLNNFSFFGPGSQFKIDTTKKVTVTTQFVTADGTDTGKLSEIRRFYVQNGVRIESPMLSVGGKQFDSVSTDFCQAEVDLFKDHTNFLEKGGMEGMDAAFEKGMVLVMSLWDDHYADMLWLDSTYPQGSSDPGAKRGTCDAASGDPKVVERDHADANVKFSNIRFGEIGSTTGSSPSPGPSPSPPSPQPGCPGGSLNTCIGLCPSSPAVAFKACVQSCVTRCSSTSTSLATVEAPTECEATKWSICGANSCCPTGYECYSRPSYPPQCVPSANLFEAFVHTHPTASNVEAFLRDGTTHFSAAGIQDYPAPLHRKVAPPATAAF